MSNYWKKKLDELNQSNANSSSRTTTSSRTSGSSDYWQNRMNELEEENKRKKAAEEERKKKVSAEEHSLVADTILGTDARDASFWDITWNSLKRGYDTARYGEESFAAMNGWSNEKEAYKQKLESDEYNFKPGNWFEEAVSGASELGGQMVRQFTHPRTLAIAGGAGIAAGIAGQAGPQIAAPEEVITVPGAIIAGFAAGNAASSLEIEAGHAYNEMIEAGISHETAGTVALLVGTANAGLEMLQVDDLMSAFTVLKGSGTTKNFKKRILDELVDRGIDVATETAQEVAQEGVTILGVQAANKADKGEWAYSLGEVAERLGDTAKSSALSFGMMNVPAAVTNTVTHGSDQATANKLTDNEQKVVDKVTEDEINEREKDGTKLSGKEKDDIRKKFIDNMKKGYIPTDTIEEVLGDKSSYDSLAKEAEEYNTLYNTASGQLSKAQQDRLAELDAKNKSNPYNDALKNAREQYSQSVFELVKGDRLVESYNERARRGQAYQADVTKYDTKQQAVIQKAIDSGILNNTNRTHEFVDMVAKISADKGVPFDFTDNEKLKASGFAIDGKTVNGYLTKDGVTLNIDSAKSLNSVVGHEIAHVLEGTEAYDALKQTLFDYAKSKGDYQGRYDSLVELYKNVKDADVEAELTADLVGDYLFTDSEFITKLSTEHRNVFQKIYDELLYLYKIATAGSKEARELEKVKKAFEKAYKEGGKAQKNTAEGDVQYSIREDIVDVNGKEYDSVVELDKTVSKRTLSEPKKFLRYIEKNLVGLKVLVTDGYGNAEVIEFAGANETVTKNKKRHPVLGELAYTKGDTRKQVIVNAEEVIQESTHDPEYSSTDNEHGWLDKNGWESRKTYVLTQDGMIYEAYLKIAKAQDGRNILYAVNLDINKGIAVDQGATSKKAAVLAAMPSADNVSQKSGDVKAKYPISDSDGKQLSKEQAEYFKDSVIRNADGNLMPMYHGTMRGGFTVFDGGKDYWYFTNDKKYAYTFEGRKANGQLYQNTKEGIEKGYYNPQRYKVYLDVKNPFVTDDIGIIEDALYWDRTLASKLREKGYDALMLEDMSQVIVLNQSQIKNVSNKKPTADPDIRYSLTEEGEVQKRYGNYNVSGKDIALEADPVTETKTPVSQTISEKESVAPVAEVSDMFPDTPMQSLEELTAEAKDIMGAMEAYEAVGDTARVEQLMPEYEAIMEKIGQLEDAERQRADSLVEADVPPEMDAPNYSESKHVLADDPFEDREFGEVGNRKVKAYMYENPEVKPFFQEEALNLLGELNDTTRAERWYNDELYYESGGENGFGGVKRHTSASMEELLDQWGMSYADIEKGLNAIIEDNGAENIAAAKKLEFMLNDRLLHGYKDFYTNGYVAPNQDYINLLNEKQITEYSKEAFDDLIAHADEYAPPASEEIVPVAEGMEIAPVTEEVAPVAPIKEAYEAIRPKQVKDPRMAKATPGEQARAQILTEEPKVNKKKPSAWNLFKDNFVDKGTVFETLSLKTGNRELQGRWKAIGRADNSAQWFMEHGNASTSSLKSIRDTVEKSGKTQQFYEYLYHQHNVDRMNLEDRYEGIENKPVFGYDVTSEMSKEEVAKLEKTNPEFKEWAKDVYDYMTYLREMMVDSGVISAETAKLWAEMYPHYVPVRRMGDDGLNINVALDSKRTGVNAPVKRATGGNRDILPLFDTMAMRTEQTFKAIARNRFGVELKNMLGTAIENEAVDIDEAIDSVETELLQEGKDGKNPTFTVFENGEKVTFEITDEMYDTMKPKSKAMGYTNKVLNTANNIRRGLLTEYNPAFMLTNPIKDTQDVLMNSQHPARTYANYPKAIAELVGKGQYYQEYMEHGGEQNTYFDGEEKTFAKEKSGLSKVVGFPFEKISQANNFIERIPRMAEYIASRKNGRSIDVSMLDAARVTTDFSAGGDLVKFANRNGFTFLNASVQGAVQQVRNVREAKAEGLKGWAKLAAKVAVAGLPSILLNNLLWDDDEDYEELSDYVKQNYYIVGKYGDGKFVRIPKGRTLAVIQNAFEQMDNLVTGDDEVDMGTFGELVLSNLAPNNPLENNLIAPITQALSNKTWYGEDLVPTRLQDLPTEEQYDETTDSVSKWLGEHTPLSPYKWNYLLDQYSGAIGDVFLPMITPEAERGNDTIAGDLIAPITDKFTTDGVLKNQNVSDFYDKKGELTTNAKASGATEEDVLMNKYMNSINSELSELYAKKREIQNSDLSNAEKYEAVRDIQKQIVDLTRESLATYDDIDYQSARDGEYVNIGNRYFKKDDEGEWQKLSGEQVTKYKVTSAAGNSSYASDGTNHYRWYVSEDGDTEGWRKISGDELDRQNKVTKGLGISPESYWDNKDEYSYAYDHPEKYAVSKAVGGYEAYRGYSKELYDIKADKDKDGKSISGSRKEKVYDYINTLDADYGEKIILFKSEYPADDTYNYEIIDYLNSRDDISYSEMETILKELGFNVSSDGNITWD